MDHTVLPATNTMSALPALVLYLIDTLLRRTRTVLFCVCKV